MLGPEQILKCLENELNIKAGEITPDLKFSLQKVVYFGCNASAPVVMIDQEIYGKMTPMKVKELLAEYN